MSSLQRSTINYFRKPLFRSWHFDAVTVIVAFFVVSGIRSMQSQSEPLKTSQAVLGLVLIPVAVWVIAVIMHSQVRTIFQQMEDTRQSRSSLPEERLARLHYGLVLGVTIASYVIIHALIATLG